MRYLWALYRLGEMDLEEGMDAATFQEVATARMLSLYSHAWTLEEQTHKGRIPVGIVCGIDCGRYIVVGDTRWFPWASKRNRIEGIVRFVNVMRREMRLVWHAEPENRDFSDHIMRHGIARRVGTLHELEPGSCAFYQSKA